MRERRAVAMGHKTYQCTADFENMGDYFCFWANYFMSHFSGYFEGGSVLVNGQASKGWERKSITRIRGLLKK
jgi:hypothetical protein